mgnify:CR=1 FL=1
MPETIRTQPVILGDGGKTLQTPIDTLRATSNASAIALSAHTLLTSATITVLSSIASNIVRVHLRNIQMRNNEQSAWLRIEWRDGGFTGRRLFGPITLQPDTEVFFNAKDLEGRAALSSIDLVILSSNASPPVSNGITANVGFLVERLDYNE